MSKGVTRNSTLIYNIWSPVGFIHPVSKLASNEFGYFRRYVNNLFNYKLSLTMNVNNFVFKLWPLFVLIFLFISGSFMLFEWNTFIRQQCDSEVSHYTKYTVDIPNQKLSQRIESQKKLWQK